MYNEGKGEKNMDKIHLFEQAGLGKAPFYYVGDAEANPCISCDYCSHAIKAVFMVQSSDGKTFRVGSDCIFKVGDAGLRVKVDQAIRQQKIKRHNQDWKWAQEAYKNYPNELSEMKHPYMDDKDMYEYIVYSLNHGHFESTEKRIISAVKKAQKLHEIHN